MKHCSNCGHSYADETLNFCLEDGAWLSAESSADEPVTAVLPEGSSSPGKSTLERETQIYTNGDFVSKEIKKHKLGATVIGAIIAVVLLGFGYGVYQFVRDAPATQPQRGTTNISTQRLTGDGKARDAEISPDGKFLAYIRVDGGNRSIWLKQVQTNSNIQIVKPGELDNFAGMTFSPDGNFLYFNAVPGRGEPASIYKVSILGGAPTKILTKAYMLRFSPDGQQICYGRYDFAKNEGGVYVAGVNGGGERNIVSRNGTKFIAARPAWSPDGKLIAIADGDDALLPGPSVSITLVSIEDGTEVQLGGKWATLDDLVWHPSGDSIILAGGEDTIATNQIWEVSNPSGSKRRLTNNLNGHGTVSITADGKSIVTGEVYARTAVWVSPDLKPENAKPVMPATGDTWSLSWTADGRIVYISDQTGDAEVWIMDADGTNARPLTNDKLFKTHPVASPDGRYIVYFSSIGSGRIIRMDINGGNSYVFENITAADNPEISPDSRWIAYSAWSGGLQRIFRVPIEGGDPQILTPNHRATEPRYSSDGTRFACFVVNNETGNFSELAIFPAEGGDPIKTFRVPQNTNIGRGPVWTPDDKGITLIVSPGELQNLWLQPVEGGEAKPLTNFQLPGVARRAYSRDGKRIALVRGEGSGNAIMISNFR